MGMTGLNNHILLTNTSVAVSNPSLEPDFFSPAAQGKKPRIMSGIVLAKPSKEWEWNSEKHSNELVDNHPNINVGDKVFFLANRDPDELENGVFVVRCDTLLAVKNDA